MKKVLITGANSYVGTNVENWLMKESDKYYVETLDMKEPSWKEFDFSKFDVVFHVAGIAHVSTKKNMRDLYFKVNRDLAIETALKAKESDVKQFIFMSSMIIYGKDNKISDFSHINIVDYNPTNAYGQSKLEADLAIQDMNSEEFKVSVLRCPIIYGKNSKGNFIKLLNISKKLPILPNIKNQRSMLFIDNLAIFVKNIISSDKSGVFYPQNNEYVSTLDIMIFAKKHNNSKIRTTKLFNPGIKLLSYLFPVFNKVFGNKTYKLSYKEESYVSFEQSMKIMRED